MSRKIKFRALNIFGDWFNFELGEHVIWENVKPGTVGQYTGLKDRRGKEIYEGDILRIVWPGDFVSGIGQVVFKKGAYVWRGYQFGGGIWGKPAGRDSSFLASGSCSLAEVIGNVHEHKKLLKKRK